MSTRLRYRPEFKENARALRKHQTESEVALWSRLRRKQIEGVQFYRQKPIGRYIVDFYAPSAQLVIEVDGSQHMQENHLRRDRERDDYLAGLGLTVLRFDSRQVLTETAGVVEVILQRIKEKLNSKIPPAPLWKGGRSADAVVPVANFEQPSAVSRKNPENRSRPHGR